MSEPCTRGCVRRDRHLSACVYRETCTGCEPRQAEYGALCYPCHKRLDEMLKQAPEQCHLLRTVSGMAAAPAARGDADLIHGTGELKTPLQLACVDTDRLIGDILSELVESLVRDYQMSGPARLETMAHREAPWTLHRKWHNILESYDWTHPPLRFTVDSAAPWLRAQILRLECQDGIGDNWEVLADAMSQAHALAPWREEAVRMNGIECPECHACALMHFGGDENVTCTRCNASITPGRYSIWTRELEQRKASA